MICGNQLAIFRRPNDLRIIQQDLVALGECGRTTEEATQTELFVRQPMMKEKKRNHRHSHSGKETAEELSETLTVSVAGQSVNSVY